MLTLKSLGFLKPASHARRNAEKNEVSATGKSARILLACDDTRLHSSIEEILVKHNFHVQMAADGDAAEELLKRHEFDLVLTEITTGNANGISLLDRVHLGHSHLPVIIISENREIEVAVGAMRQGACDYLPRPFEPKKLLSAVERALGRKQVVNVHENYQEGLEHIVRTRSDMLLQALQDLERSYDVTLEALGEALDLRDSETEGHSQRVTAYSIALARAMNLGPTEIKSIARGAFLHDIGKIAIPDQILRKTGPLDRQEREIMREHCARGFHMLRNIQFLRDAAEIVLSHQEHFDGNGYPRRLRGNEIPLGARIFAVSDALDAITSERPYRKPVSFEDAREEIQRCSGTQFDPAVVDIFLDMPIELWQELRAEIDSRSEQITAFDPSHISDIQPLQ
jgi:putative nucleotidyltransferase with HDIG domain